MLFIPVYNETYFNEKEGKEKLQKQKYRIKLPPSLYDLKFYWFFGRRLTYLIPICIEWKHVTIQFL